MQVKAGHGEAAEGRDRADGQRHRAQSPRRAGQQMPQRAAGGEAVVAQPLALRRGRGQRGHDRRTEADAFDDDERPRLPRRLHPLHLAEDQPSQSVADEGLHGDEDDERQHCPQPLHAARYGTDCSKVALRYCGKRRTLRC